MIRQLIDAPAADFAEKLPAGLAAGARGPTRDAQLLDKIEGRLRDLLGGYQGPFEVLGIPLVDWQISLAAKDLTPLDRLVISACVPDLEALEQFRRAFDDHLPFYGIGADLSLPDRRWLSGGKGADPVFGVDVDRSRNVSRLVAGPGPHVEHPNSASDLRLVQIGGFDKQLDGIGVGHSGFWMGIQVDVDEHRLTGQGGRGVILAVDRLLFRKLRTG